MPNKQTRYVLTEEIEASLKKIDEVQAEMLKLSRHVLEELARFRSELEEIRRDLKDNEFQTHCRHKLAKKILDSE